MRAFSGEGGWSKQRRKAKAWLVRGWEGGGVGFFKDRKDRMGKRFFFWFFFSDTAQELRDRAPEPFLLFTSPRPPRGRKTDPPLLSSTRPLPPATPLLKQPNPSEKQEHGKSEGEPGSPADAGAALGHAEHAVHGAAEAGAGAVEAVVHVGGEGGGGGDFGGDGEGDLCLYDGV